MSKTSDRIKEGMELRGFRQSDLVERTGISKGALSSYISGRYTPKQNNVYLIAKALDVSEAWLMGADVPIERIDMDASTNDNIIKLGKSINVLGRVAAGIPMEAIEEIIDTEEISEDLAKTGEFFGLQIHGDSMEPRFTEGDVVIVRKQDDAESGDIVIATVNGDEATCKRLRKFRDGIELVSTNLSYKPMFFTNKEILEKPVKILGKVVELRAKF